MKMKKIPVEKGLFDIPSSKEDPVYLNGSRCKTCGRYHFPVVERCYVCSGQDLEDVKMGRNATIYTYTNNNYTPPGGIYKGKVPYGLGVVLLDEGILITTRINEADPSKLKIGMKVELMLETLYTDNEKNEEVVCFTYNPVK